MLDRLTEQPADKILSLMTAFRADPREDKIDLGVGVYRDPAGNTPVMRAVKAAEKRIWEDQSTKAYTGLAGDPAFADAMVALVLDDSAPRKRVAAVATPGGTGAVRQAIDLVKQAAPSATIWLSNPTWPNHTSIIRHLGMASAEYRYFDAATGGVDIEGMLEDLAGAAAGDVVLLHGCCHNPTGANLAAEEWGRLVALMTERGLVPLIDLAYQGFGDGLEADAAATRRVVTDMPECLIAASCSKNFGIYRERTGILMAVAQDEAQAKIVQGNLNHLNRQNYSFPPDHGARIVATILNDPDLRADWEAELDEVRQTMLDLRIRLSGELARLTNSDRYAFIAEHRGMFSRLGLPPETVEALRADHGVYMVGDSRINIAGLNTETVPVLARAIVAAGG